MGNTRFPLVFRFDRLDVTVTAKRYLEKRICEGFEGKGTLYSEVGEFVSMDIGGEVGGEELCYDHENFK